MNQTLRISRPNFDWLIDAAFSGQLTDAMVEALRKQPQHVAALTHNLMEIGFIPPGRFIDPKGIQFIGIICEKACYLVRDVDSDRVYLGNEEILRHTSIDCLAAESEYTITYVSQEDNQPGSTIHRYSANVDREIQSWSIPTGIVNQLVWHAGNPYFTIEREDGQQELFVTIDANAQPTSLGMGSQYLHVDDFGIHWLKQEDKKISVCQLHHSGLDRLQKITFAGTILQAIYHNRFWAIVYDDNQGKSWVITTFAKNQPNILAICSIPKTQVIRSLKLTQSDDDQPLPLLVMSDRDSWHGLHGGSISPPKNAPIREISYHQGRYLEIVEIPNQSDQVQVSWRNELSRVFGEIKFAQVVSAEHGSPIFAGRTGTKWQIIVDRNPVLKCHDIYQLTIEGSQLMAVVRIKRKIFQFTYAV